MHAKSYLTRLSHKLCARKGCGRSQCRRVAGTSAYIGTTAAITDLLSPARQCSMRGMFRRRDELSYSLRDYALTDVASTWVLKERCIFAEIDTTSS